MIPISMRSFPEQPLAKRPLGKPWAREGWQAMGCALRHQRWALGITSKLARRSRRPGLHSEPMTLTHPFRRRILRLQTLVQHTRSETRLPHPAVRELKAPGCSAAHLRLEANRQIALPSQNTVERGQSLVSFVREILHRTAPATASVALVRPNRTVEFVGKIVTPPIPRSALGKAESVASLTLSPSRRSALGAASRPDESDPSAAALSERVMRRHRRVEARPFVQARGAAPQISPAPAPEPPVVVHRTLARRPAQRFDESIQSDPRQQSAPQAPNIHIGQITDAVLQQLDRRLIAARERMGRI